MSLASNKILLAGSASVVNTPGAYFQSVTLTFTSTSVGVTIPAGQWQALPTANVTVGFNTSNNANSLSLTTIIPANTAAYFASDGVNVFANTTNTSATITLYGSNSGENAPGTYNK